MDRLASGRAPLARVAVGLTLGLALTAVDFTAGLAAWCTGPLLLLGSARRPWRPLCWSALLGLLLGGAERADRELPAWLLSALPAHTVLEGNVQHVFPARGRRLRFVLHAAWIGEAPRRRRLDREVMLSLWLRGRIPRRPDAVEPGVRVRCLVHLEQPPSGPRRIRRGRAPLEGRVLNPRYLEPLPVVPGLGEALFDLRRRAARRYEERLAPRDAGLARALLLGDRTRLDPRDRAVFRRAGQAHLLAVSGLHVGLLLAGVAFVLRRCGCPLRLTWIAGLLVAALYVPFTGAPPSAVRAGVGASIYFIGRLLGRPVGGLAVLCLVATIVLVSKPPALLDVSFQLSFAAVLGILLLSPRIQRVLVRPRPVLPGLLPRRRTPVRTSLSVALGAWFGAAPFVAEHIGRLCPAGAPLSLAALPLAAALLATGCALLLIGPWAGSWPGDLAAAGFGWVADLLRSVLERADDLGLGVLPVGRPPPGWWPAYAAAFVLAVRGLGWRSRLGLACLPLLLAGLGLVEQRGHGPTAGPAPGGEYHAPPSAMPANLPALMPADAGVFALQAGALLAFAFLSVRPLRWLSAGGATAAWILGVATAWQFGWIGIAALFAPFTVATLLGKLPGTARSGARSLRQVVSNGLPALAGCAVAAAGPTEVGLALFLGGLSCLGADTCATEIGVRYGGQPFRLAGRGSVARGESGGVTVLGLVASFLGALLAPGVYALIAGAPPATVGVLAAAGAGGALIDSVLGGTLQYRGVDPGSGDLVEARIVGGRASSHRSGWRWLDNDAVNLVTGVLAALAAVGLVGLL